MYGQTFGPKDSLHLVSSALNVRDVFEHRTRNHHVGFGVRKGKPIRDVGDERRIGCGVRCQLGGRDVNRDHTEVFAVLKLTGEGAGPPATNIDNGGSRPERADRFCDVLVVTLIESNVLTRVEPRRETRVCVDESSEEGDLRTLGSLQNAPPDACAV